MMKFTNFCGIFATIFVTTTIILLASCSQDDETYDSDMYTLAEEMGTRSGGNGGDPGGGGGEGTIDTVYLCGDLGEHWVHFLSSSLTGTSLKVHLYALADSSLTHWAARAQFDDRTVEVESITADYVSSDSLNVNLRLNIEIFYQNKYWTGSNTYSCPRALFLGSSSI